MAPAADWEKQYQRLYQDLQKQQPEVSGFFYNACQFYSGRALPDGPVLQSLYKLALSSKYIFINFHILLPLLIAKNELHYFCDIMARFARVGYKQGQAFLAAYLPLKYPLKSIARAMDFFIESLSISTLKSNEALSFCLKQSTPETCVFLLKVCGTVLRYASGMLKPFITLYDKTLVHYPRAQLTEWLNRGIDLLSSQRIEEGIYFLLARSRESRWLLGLNHVTLNDLKGVLKIYSASLAGREMNIVSLEISAFKVKAPYTDGRSLFLPPSIEYFPDSARNEKAYTVLAAQQAASISMGTFELDIQKLGFRNELREKYGTVLPEIVPNVARQYGQAAQRVRERADGEIEITFSSGRQLIVLNSQHEKFYYSFPTPNFARDLFMLVENARIESQLSALYPGLKQDFKSVNQVLWRMRPELVPPEEDIQARFLTIVEALTQHALAGRYRGDPGPQKLKYQINYVTHRFDQIHNPDATVHDAAAVTFDLYNYFFDNFPLVALINQLQDFKAGRIPAKPEILPEVVLDVTPQLLKQEGLHINPEELKGRHEDQSIDLTAQQEKNREGPAAAAIGSQDFTLYKYPEYNLYKSIKEKDRCLLFERTLPESETGYYEAVRREYKQEYKRIRKRFMFLKPEEVELSRHWYLGEDLHLTDAVDYAISLARGELPDEKIYFRKIKNRRDIVTAILLDSSSSTDEVIGGTKKIEIEKAALSILSSALDLIGDNFGLFSYYSMGPERVFFNIIKDFDEPWDAAAYGRLPNVTAYASNRDGCAIRHASHKLLDQSYKTRLLILLSDGIPADIGYGGASPSETSEYAIEDTRRAIVEARQQGIIPYCITIDRFARNYIPRLYGDYQYVILDDVAALPAKLSQLYLKLTR